MHKKHIIALTLAIILLATSMILASENYNSPIYTSSFTKAICTESNYCQDFYIYCKNKNIINATPITGSAIMFSKEWEDPRTNTENKDFCK